MESVSILRMVPDFFNFFALFKGIEREVKVCKEKFVSCLADGVFLPRMALENTPLFFPWLSKGFLNSASGALHPQTPRPGRLSVGTHCG